jgi:hypothetical protein
MEWELVKPWVNRVGIVLEFLSFWLAAPEILGEERLRALERGAEKGMLLLPLVALTLIILPTALALAIMPWEAIPEAWTVTKWLRVVMKWSAVALIVLWLFLIAAAVFPTRVVGSKHLEKLWASAAYSKWHKRPTLFIRIGLAALLVGSGLYVILLHPNKWSVGYAFPFLLLFAAFLMSEVWIYLVTRIAPYWLPRLADDSRIRQRSLAVGAVLFVVGFVLQLIATF